MPAIHRLSTVGVAKTRTPGYYTDGGGLLLQVSRTGTKSWLFRYRMEGKRHEMGLGPCGLVDLAQARELALGCGSGANRV